MIEWAGYATFAAYGLLLAGVCVVLWLVKRG
jgi:hypothetical protein